MPLTLAQYEARVAVLLADVPHSVFSIALLDEGLRLALHEYSLVAPQELEQVIVCPAAGREIALNNLTGLLNVVNVWWPYATTGAEVWPPNQVRGFRVWWDNGQAVLFLNIGVNARSQSSGYTDAGVLGIGSSRYSGQPQLNDNVRVWYTATHTIQNLDSGATTTLPPPDESLLVLGAAGYTCLAVATSIAQSTTIGVIAPPNYSALAQTFLYRFNLGMVTVRSRIASHGADPYGAGWIMDKWDSRGDEWLR